MGIFEIVFPQVKEGAALRQELFERLPLLGPTTFQGAPGLCAVYRAKVLNSHGPTAQGHPGFMPMPLWKDVSYFDKFIKSQKFATFKESLDPYLTGAPDIQLYQSPGSGTAQEIMANSSHVQVFKLETNGSDADLKKAEEAWSRFVRVLSSVVRDLGHVLPYFHQATGLRQVSGVYLGVIGWESLAISESVTADERVEEALRDMENAEGLLSVSTLFVETLLIVPVTER